VRQSYTYASVTASWSLAPRYDHLNMAPILRYLVWLKYKTAKPLLYIVYRNLNNVITYNCDKIIAKVHPVYLVNIGLCRPATNFQTKPNNLELIHESACRLLSSAPTISVLLLLIPKPLHFHCLIIW